MTRLTRQKTAAARLLIFRAVSNQQLDQFIHALELKAVRPLVIAVFGAAFAPLCVQVDRESPHSQITRRAAENLTA
ncbi:MAG: hypothetical protein ACREIW_06095 [Chthoniobacterales bacterium]